MDLTSNPCVSLIGAIDPSLSAYLAAAVVGGTACGVGIASQKVRGLKTQAKRRQAVLEKAEDDRRKLIKDMEKLQREKTSLVGSPSQHFPLVDAHGIAQ